MGTTAATRWHYDWGSGTAATDTVTWTWYTLAAIVASGTVARLPAPLIRRPRLHASPSSATRRRWRQRMPRRWKPRPSAHDWDWPGASSRGPPVLPASPEVP